MSRRTTSMTLRSHRESSIERVRDVQPSFLRDARERQLVSPVSSTRGVCSRTTNLGGALGIAMAVGGLSTSLNPNVHQGYFAEAFVASIAAAAGLDVQLPRLGQRIDLGVFRPGVNGTSGSRQINLQVKSWSTGTLNADGNFHYPLEVPAFNYLAGEDHDVRHYLVLCIVPQRPLAIRRRPTSRQLRLQQAAYWLSLRNDS